MELFGISFGPVALRREYWEIKGITHWESLGTPELRDLFRSEIICKVGAGREVPLCCPLCRQCWVEVSSGQPLQQSGRNASWRCEQGSDGTCKDRPDPTRTTTRLEDKQEAPLSLAASSHYLTRNLQRKLLLSPWRFTCAWPRTCTSRGEHGSWSPVGPGTVLPQGEPADKTTVCTSQHRAPEPTGTFAALHYSCCSILLWISG